MCGQKKKKREIIGGFTGGFIGKTVGENLTTLEIFLKCWDFPGLPWWLRWSRIPLQCRGNPSDRPEVDPWVGKIPWRRERLPTPVFWPGDSMDCPWGRIELDMAEQLSLSLMVQWWLRIHLAMQGILVRSLVWKDPHALGQLSLCTTTIEPMF